jgi:sulfur carrier protein
MPSPDTIQVTVNDQPLEIAEGSSIAALLNTLDIRTNAIAVEINHKLIPGDQHTSTIVQANDRLEVVTLVGGG